MPLSSSTSPRSQAASSSPGSSSPASREVEDWSPAKWAYYEEVCHDILLPDWDDLTVGERREWEGLWQREREREGAEKAKKIAEDKKKEQMGREKRKERENKAGENSKAITKEMGLRTGTGGKSRWEDGRGDEDDEGAKDGQGGEEQDGSNGSDFEVNGVAELTTATNTRKREAKDKHISIKPTTIIKDLETTGMSLGRGSRAAKLQGDSKRREQMLEETLSQSQSQITDDGTEDEHPYPQPQRQKGKGNRQRGRERLEVEEYQPPRLQRRQHPARFTPTITAPTSRYESAYQRNRMYEIQSDQDSLPSKVASIWASPAPRLSFDRLVTGLVTGSERVYVSPYPALPARAPNPTPAPGKGPVGVERGGKEELERDRMKIGGGLRKDERRSMIGE